MRTQGLSFTGALSVPFRIAPLENAVQLLFQLIRLAIAPIGVLVTAYFIDTALLVAANDAEANRMFLPLAALGAFAVYSYVSQPLMGLVAKRREIKTRLALRVPFLEKRVRLEYKHVENPDSMDLLSRVWANPEEQISGMLDNLVGFIVLVGITLSYLVILLVNAPLAGIILTALSAPMFMLASRAGKAQYQAYREASKDFRLFNAFASYICSRENAAERNLFGYADFMSDKFLHHIKAERKRRLRVGVIWFVRSKISAVILGLLSAAGLFVMAPSVASGSISVGLFISLQGALFAIVSWIGWSLPRHFEEFATQREFIKDVNAFLALSEMPDAECLPDEPVPEFRSLEFKNVTFSYPGTEKIVLDKLSFVIEAGKHYAFVGANGAGKTTLTKLITRLYSGYEGEVLLNGKPLEDFPLAQVKAVFCALFQDFARYDVSVADNAAIGKINGADRAEIEESIRLSGFETDSVGLKDGLDTLLGKTHEDGVDLSGGQWQRLAFARALISPAPVKILDEPTSALDPVAESQVYAQFERLSKGFTTIFISHRLASAKLADMIFVLEGGKVAEQGNHSQLMKSGGVYAEMFESQMSWYTDSRIEMQL